jgi:hypothetical protein
MHADFHQRVKRCINAAIDAHVHSLLVRAISANNLAGVSQYIAVAPAVAVAAAAAAVDGEPLLSVALRTHASVAIVRALIDANISVHEWVWPCLINPLTYVLRHRRRESAELVALLCEAGVNVNGRDAEGNTPLFYACCAWPHTSSEIACLLHFGANPHRTNNAGETPLDWSSNKFCS